MSASVGVSEQFESEKRSEALSLQRKRFDALVRAHAAVVWTTDAQGMFVAPQSGWEAYTGQAWPEQQGGGGIEKIHPDDRLSVMENWRKVVELHSRWDFEMRIWHAASQTYRWCSFRGEPVLSDDGEVLEWIGTMVDVDERKRADIEIRERERRFSTILERVQAIGLMLDASGRVTFANDFLLELTGWAREEVIGRDYFKIFVKGTSDIEERFHRAIASGDIFAHAENDIVTRTGEHRLIEWDNTVLRDGNGNVVGTASIGRDITDKKRLLESLSDKEERLRTLVEAMPQLVWSTRPDGYCEYLSKQWLEYTGQNENDAIGMGWLSAVHPEDEERTRAHWIKFAAGNAKYDTEYRLRRHDGVYRWFKARAAIVHGPNGEVLGYFGTSTDIHDHKTAEEALRTSEESLRVALLASQTGTFRWDPKSGRFLEFDSNLRQLFGFNDDDPIVTTEDFLNRVHPSDRDAVIQNVQRCFEGADFEMEYRVELPESGVRWLYDRGRMIKDDAGNALYLVGACTDITPRKKAEEALLHSEKLSAAGSLAATLAHEINNPLEALLNLIFIAKQPFCSDTQRLEMLEAAEREITRASELAKRSLRFYRGSKSGQTESVQKVLDTVLYVYEPRLHQHGIKVEKQYVADGGVDVSESDLRQVFYNLVSNAADAMPQGGRLIVKISRDSNTRLRVTVADTGTGVKKENRASVFNPFFTTKGDTGTGLGLWVTREIVDRARGRIQFRSSTAAERHGTAMSVLLPILLEKKQAVA